jgi:predicted ArsR family transcriptional regulator
MTRKEQLFALVTDAGITAEEGAKKIGIDGSKARMHYAELANAGRVHRGWINNGAVRYFRSAEAARAFDALVPPISEREATVQAAVSDTGWTGYTLSPVLGMDSTSLRRDLHRLATAGRVHAGTNARGVTRYFKTREAADLFASTKPPSAIPSTVQVKATVKGFANAEVVRPAHVKVQRCPGFQGLGFAEPAKVEGGAFASLGIGKYLEETAG